MPQKHADARVHDVKKSAAITLRLESELLDKIEDERKKVKPKPSRNWMVRHLLEKGIEAEIEKRKK